VQYHREKLQALVRQLNEYRFVENVFGFGKLKAQMNAIVVQLLYQDKRMEEKLTQLAAQIAENIGEQII
jgi:hypothetical protein